MDPRILEYYNRELVHIRHMGAEFAREFPAIARRLGMEGIEVADPYVERLLEGFAFLAARVHLRLDSQFPLFTQHLLEMVYPHFLCPIPSAAVVQIQPAPQGEGLAAGYLVPRGSVLRSRLGRGDVTPCEYRTAHDLRLFPLEIGEVEYVTYSRDLAVAQGRGLGDVRAALRVRLRTTASIPFDKLALGALVLHLRGAGETPSRLYEQIHGHALGVLVRPVKQPAPWVELLPRSSVRPLGFADDEALLANDARVFGGYRLLREYFAFPERFLFARIDGLAPAVRRTPDVELDLFVLFGHHDPALLNVVDAGCLALHCTPAVNLFPMRCDNIHLGERTAEHHVLPDRARPLDFEVYQVTAVRSTGSGAEAGQEFRPFYALEDADAEGGGRAYYTVRREPRRVSDAQRRNAERTAHAGSEVFLSLVDGEAAPHRPDTRLLAVEALCTNRDLPLSLTLGQGRSDFNLQEAAPVEVVRCVAGPTAPRPSLAHGDVAWRLVSHLSLNYLSLIDDAAGNGTKALRELLSLYVTKQDAAANKQIQGLSGIEARPVIRRIPVPGPIAFGRGLEITVTFDETAFQGSGVFLLGAVLEEFFARYVSVNGFTATVLRTLERGEIMRWPARAGNGRVL